MRRARFAARARFAELTIANRRAERRGSQGGIAVLRVGTGECAAQCSAWHPALSLRVRS
jgi:hypothetical protein